MSETEKENTTAQNASQPKKKSKLFLIIGLVVVLIAGGGGGFYFWSKTKAEAAEKSEAETSSKKSKAKKDSKETEEKTEKSEKSEKADKENSVEVSLPDDEDVKQVVEIQPFIVNLADTDSAKYLRMTVSLGIGDEGEEKPEALFLTRVKNAMLAVLTTKKSEDVLSVEGKTKLRKELLKAAQAASEKPHVEAIYITDFIVQL